MCFFNTKLLCTCKKHFDLSVRVRFQEDEQQFVKSLLIMKQRNQYEVEMDDTKFPRRFPIDNEDYET